MRDIKFRAWYTYRNSFYVYGSKAIRMLIEKPNGSDVVLEQYTGIKDKNGVEIYENDIVRVQSHLYKDHIGAIIWLQGTASFCISDNTNKFNIPRPLTIQMDGFLSYEVVGNIHENADLLEVGNDI